MQSTPLISVIVPVYNAEQHLSQCLDSLLKQTYSNIEVICIDDKSSDNSWISLSQYAQVDSRIIPIQLETNSGAGVARDTGIIKARGEFIMFVDADDFIENDHISCYVDIANKDTDIVLASYYINKNNRDKLIPSPDSPYTSWLRTSPCIRLYRTEFLRCNNINFRGERYYEDIVFNYRCMVNNPSVLIIPYAGYHYCINDLSVTQKKQDTLPNYAANIKNHRKFWEEIKSKKLPQEIYDILEYSYTQNLTIGMLYNIKRSNMEDYACFLQLRNELLNDIFPNYAKNKFIGIRKLPEEYSNIRFVLAVYQFIEKIHLEKLLLKLLA